MLDGIRSLPALSLFMMAYGAWVAFLQMPPGGSRLPVLLVGLGLAGWAWYQSAHYERARKQENLENTQERLCLRDLQERTLKELAKLTEGKEKEAEAARKELPANHPRLVELEMEAATARTALQSRRLEWDTYYGQNLGRAMHWLNQSPFEKPEYFADNQLPTPAKPSEPDTERPPSSGGAP